MSSKSAVFALALVAAASLIVYGVQAADDVFEGKVLSVGEGSLMIMGKTNNDNKAFKVNAETKVMRNGKPAKLADVQIGDKAKVSGSGMGTDLVAKEIIATSPEGFRFVRRIWR